MSTLEKAIAIAATAHAGQKDKAGEFYILHSIRVMMKLKTEEERITGVLHDILEDTLVTLEDLKKEGFSESVIQALSFLAKQKGIRYDNYINNLNKNPLAKKVKLADLEDNMNLQRLKSPTPKDFERLKKYEKAYASLKGDLR